MEQAREDSTSAQWQHWGRPEFNVLSHRILHPFHDLKSTHRKWAPKHRQESVWRLLVLAPISRKDAIISNMKMLSFSLPLLIFFLFALRSFLSFPSLPSLLCLGPSDLGVVTASAYRSRNQAGGQLCIQCCHSQRLRPPSTPPTPAGGFFLCPLSAWPVSAKS